MTSEAAMTSKQPQSSHSHAHSRYILLLGAGDAKEEVAKEAKIHLYGAVGKLQQQSEGGPRARR